MLLQLSTETLGRYGENAKQVPTCLTIMVQGEEPECIYKYNWNAYELQQLLLLKGVLEGQNTAKVVVDDPLKRLYMMTEYSLRSSLSREKVIVYVQRMYPNPFQEKLNRKSVEGWKKQLPKGKNTNRERK